MQCTLHPLFDRGMLMPKHRHCMLARESGELSITEEPDTIRQRQTRLARLMRDGTDAVRPLYDAQVVTIGHSYMVISGIERYADLDWPVFEFAQSWWVEFSTAQNFGRNG